MASSSSSSTGVPPGFRFHPTDEELLLYYLKKKMSLEKFDLEVIREVDLNKIEPWELQERCRIGATPQNEWYFFSHKDRKYPTGSRTNRATIAGFWKATGRDKCIRTTYKKIGMRKTLVFYRGRAPHGLKTDWIMHEYRLEESDDDQGGGSEDGWVVCRVFKKKYFFKTGGSSDGSSSQGADAAVHIATATSAHDQSRSGGSGLYMQHHHQPPSFHHDLHLHPQVTTASFLNYPYNQLPTNPYSQIQVQDLLPNPRPPPATAYDFSVNVDNCEQSGYQNAGGDQGREVAVVNDWTMIDGAVQHQQQMSQQLGVQQQQPQQRGAEMDLWGYGK